MRASPSTPLRGRCSAWVWRYGGHVQSRRRPLPPSAVAVLSFPRTATRCRPAVAVRHDFGDLVFEYLRRLATTGAAYTASSVLSKLIAVALLPIYTAALTPADYGAAEVVLASVIALSIIVRLGLIEALLRFYYLPDVDRPEVVRTGFAALFWSTTA